jgi:hypothetical protein
MRRWMALWISVDWRECEFSVNIVMGRFWLGVSFDVEACVMDFEERRACIRTFNS